LPDSLAVEKAAHVVAADQRDMVAEFFLEQVDQAAAVLALFGGHIEEHLGRPWKIRVQALGDIHIDPAVFLLGADREGEDFTFTEFGEIAHCGKMQSSRGLVKICVLFDIYSHSQIALPTAPMHLRMGRNPA
jgi:hypothetical protein